MPGIGVISNRNARLNRLNPQLKEQLAFVIGSDGDVASTGTLDDVYGVCELFKKVDIDIVAISGGDGTAHRTLEIMLEVYGDRPLPPILLLPTGTQNMVPKSFGIEGNGLSTLMMAMARYRHNVPMRCIKRNLLRVNGHIGFLFAIGLATRFMAHYYAGSTTPLGAAALLAKMIKDGLTDGDYVKELGAPLNLKFKINNENWIDKENTHIFFASFVERLPLHFVLFPEAGKFPGQFQIAYSEASPLSLAKVFPQILTGCSNEVPGVSRTLVKSLEIKLAQPEVFTLDGDMYDAADHFRIVPGPELDFVIPNLKFSTNSDTVRYGKAGPWAMRFML